MTNDNPCHGCPRRHALCHGSCPDYATFRQQKDEENAAKRAAKGTSTWVDAKEFQLRLKCIASTNSAKRRKK